MKKRDQPISIIPPPAHVEMRDGTFTISPTTGVVFDRRDEAARRAADHLIETIARSAGFRMGADGPRAITFAHSSDPSLGADGYELDITPNEITVRASNTPGQSEATPRIPLANRSTTRLPSSIPSTSPTSP